MLVPMTTQPADPGVQARSGERPRLPAHARILGLPVHDLTLPELVDRVRDWLRAEPDRLHQIVTLNPEMVMAARRLPEFRAAIEQADLVTADGIGIVLAARVLGRPARLRAPAGLLRLALGEMADEMLLAGARVVPRRLLESGYAFRFAELEPALRHLLGAGTEDPA